VLESKKLVNKESWSQVSEMVRTSREEAGMRLWKDKRGGSRRRKGNVGKEGECMSRSVGGNFQPFARSGTIWGKVKGKEPRSEDNIS